MCDTNLRTQMFFPAKEAIVFLNVNSFHCDESPPSDIRPAEDSQLKEEPRLQFETETGS